MNRNPFTILLVDDNAVNREVWSAHLTREGFEVKSAAGGEQALGLVEEFPIDLVLLDVVMPDMDGFQVLEALRQDYSASALPVIMVTAKGESDDVVQGFDLGASDYVTKPLDAGVLLARVNAQLRSRIPASATSPPPSPLGEGSVLDGKYQLDALIDKGNFGTVYRATHLTLGHRVAVKLLSTTLDTDPPSVTRFQQEGISACRIQHPNAVDVLDFSITSDGVPFLVMELLEGHSLDHEIQLSGPLSPLRCAVLLTPICEVLGEAHGLGIIHRDIKPQNIFLHRGRHGEVVKVLDFGIAKMVGEMALHQKITTEGSIVGTPAYMAPERLSDESYDGQSDVYSLGILIYEALAGKRPYDDGTGGGMMELVHMRERGAPPPLQGIRPDIPASIDHLLFEALSRYPQNRPTAIEFAQRFNQILGMEDDLSTSGSGRVTLPRDLLDELLRTASVERMKDTDDGWVTTQLDLPAPDNSEDAG